MKLSAFLIIASLLALSASLPAQSVPVPKTNPMKVYMHYMPWFQTPETLGGTNWGWHWTMNNQNPNIIEPNGQRQIASNYYPLIGPYDSSDPNVIEYHMLLMKLSGVDGVIVDWYGQQGTNGDINSLLSASNTIISMVPSYGLNFAVCLEDRFAASTSQVTANINYASQNYFSNPAYIHVGPSSAPLLPVFGPVTYQQPSQWSTIMAGVQATPAPAIMPLWYQSQQVGSPAAGEFSWIYQDQGTSDQQTLQQNFLTQRAPTLGMTMGVAYPGYNDFYAQGDAGPGAGFTIPSNNGQTLANLLSLDSTYSSSMNMLQLATFNDYGEGTMFEPTVQTGFTYLQQLQKFTGVPYGLSQLQLVYQLYEARTELAGNTAGQATLNQTSNDINQLNFTAAHSSLAQALASTPTTISAINALTLSGTAALDLTNNHLIVNYSGTPDPVATIYNYLKSGDNGGNWNGLGIDSSTAAAANPSYGIGFVDSADHVAGATVATGQILIAYALYGDVNLDGLVNATDFAVFGANYNTSITGWDHGDFLYNGLINGSDFALLGENFGKSASGTALSLPASDYAALDAFAAANGLLADVPEPASAAILLITLTAAIARRRPSSAP